MAMSAAGTISDLQNSTWTNPHGHDWDKSLLVRNPICRGGRWMFVLSPCYCAVWLNENNSQVMWNADVKACCCDWCLQQEPHSTQVFHTPHESFTCHTSFPQTKQVVQWHLSLQSDPDPDPDPDCSFGRSNLIKLLTCMILTVDVRSGNDDQSTIRDYENRSFLA